MGRKVLETSLKTAGSLGAFEVVNSITHDPHLAGAVVTVFNAAADQVVSKVADTLLHNFRPAKIWRPPTEHLHEQLAKVDDAASLKLLLKEMSRTSESTTYVENSFRAAACMREGRLSFLIDTLLQLVSTHLGRNEAWVHASAAVLTRFASEFENFQELRGLHDKLEKTVATIEPDMVPTIECIAYICHAQKMSGLFVGNTVRYVNDPGWGKTDAAEGNEYYGCEQSSLGAIVHHLSKRSPEFHAQDLARLLYLYPILKDTRAGSANAVLAKHGMLKALKAHDGFKNALVSRVEDILEGEREWRA